MTKPFRLGLLATCRLNPAMAARTPGGLPGVFARWFAGFDVAITAWNVFEQDFPPDPAAADGWAITGSPASVYDGSPWIAPLEAFVRAASEARPVLGLCFGHQLIAQAFGGRVAPAPGGWSAGLMTYDAREGPAAPAGPLRLHAMHRDHVERPPAGADILARSDSCAVAMMRLGPRLLSFQAHPEFDRGFMADLIADRRALLGAETADRARASLDAPPGPTPVVAAVARWMGMAPA